MSSKPTERRSIASQLVLRFTAAAAILLSCGLGFFYWMVIRHAFTEDNLVLADKVAALRADFAETGPQVFAQEFNAHRAAQHAPFLIRILDPTGQIIAETPGMNALIPSAAFPPPTGSTSGNRAPKNYKTGGKLFSLLAIKEGTDGYNYTIQIAQDRSSDQNLEIEVGALLIAVLAGGIVVSAVIAVTVTKRSLHPLDEMTRSLERIGPTHLDERVAPEGWPRELQPLALGFDDMLARLEDSFTRLSQFSADLAHELRTPIANILGEAQVALTRDRSPAEYREVIESTIAESERLSGIVDNLLFVARADSTREPVERQLFDGRAAVEKIANFYRTLAEDRHVAIHCTGEGKIYADPVLFERAMSNLVDNALRFSPDGGEIKIALTTSDRSAEVTVADNGSGIPREHLPRVFDRFYRADPSRSSAGAGLGLALVKSIVDLHAGSVRIESEVGRGTMVVLTFPNQSGATGTKSFVQGPAA